MKKPYEDIREEICPVCGKNFVVPPLNIYKHRKNGKPVCSWSCCNKTSVADGSVKRVTVPKKRICNRCLYFQKNWCSKKNEATDKFGKCNMWTSDKENEEKKEDIS